jgi:hypothetical protein
MTVVPHIPHFCLFPRLKIKPEGRYFDTVEVIDAESHGVLAVHPHKTQLQDAFKK